MNITMTLDEYERLPFRDDCQFYITGQRYRARAYAKAVFVFVGKHENAPEWHCFTPDLIEEGTRIKWPSPIN